MTSRIVCIALGLATLASMAAAEIRRDPNGVNVNASGATTVFITFGGLDGQRPAEATWCGELVAADPDIGMRCAPGTVFGRLPGRFDVSRVEGPTFTDVMSIPPSVARRAYQDATRGATSSFFYVRRFVSSSGGPDEFVFVTCRMAGGGARVPLSLTDVRLAFETGDSVLAIGAGETLPALSAEISYNGTGRLRGRWELVQPGDDPPTDRDLLPEASLPPDERVLQRRYRQVSRFNVFLPPTGRVVIPGPSPAQLPSNLEGTYMILLRVEASDDKEGDSNLDKAGAGDGIVHSGAVAGFALPPLRYVVGGAPGGVPGGRIELLTPAENADVGRAEPLVFSWTAMAGAALYRLEIETIRGDRVHAAILEKSTSYRAPAGLAERAPIPALRWRVTVLGAGGVEIEAAPWRSLRFK